MRIESQEVVHWKSPIVLCRQGLVEYGDLDSIYGMVKSSPRCVLTCSLLHASHMILYVRRFHIIIQRQKIPSGEVLSPIVVRWCGTYSASTSSKAMQPVVGSRNNSVDSLATARSMVTARRKSIRHTDDGS